MGYDAARVLMIRYDRKKFTAEELSLCLSHYDLGVIHSVREFPRGSRRAPKVLIEAERGRVLFKRRAHGKDRQEKVAFTHEIQLHLAAFSFPLPHLIRTRDEGHSMLVHGGHVYEMFEFMEGEGYDGSLDATEHAGTLLGQYHKLLEDFESSYRTPTGGYHDAAAINDLVRNTVASLPLENRPPAEEITSTVGAIRQTYLAAARRANELGLGEWQHQIVHGDWHPGNMLFHGGMVAAVIDYDAAREQPRVLDVANGALQFSIIGGGNDPDTWPDFADETRFARFLHGYHAVDPLSAGELQAIPYLMCEAIIAEAVLPIATTGSFGRIEGFPFLRMVQRKTNWMLDNAERLSRVLEAV